MVRLVERFAFDDRGATAIEYGLIAAMIAMAAIAAFTAFGTSFSNLFGVVGDKTSAAIEDALDD